MGRYYVNKDALEKGDHEVHTWECALRPPTDSCHDLGEFSAFADAVTEALKTNPQAKACLWCCLAPSRVSK
jgi:hypothetical protein